MPNDEPNELKSLQQAYSKTFSSEEGKIVLADLKKRCFFDKITINESSNWTAFNEGTRSVVLHILNQMKLNLLKGKSREELEHGQSRSE